MIFDWLLHRKPSQPLRAYVAVRSENKAAARKAVETQLSLAVAIAQLTPEQKAEAIKRAATVKFETPEQRFKRIERKAFAGMAVSPLGKGAT